MKVHTATLAGGDNNQDRVFVTDNAVIVLDGATAFEPVDVDAGLYAETLGAALAEQLDNDAELPIADAVATAITYAAKKLALTSDLGPSSTVSALRARPQAIDLYVLGDSPIYYAYGDHEHVLTDRRLSVVAGPEREHYVSRLKAGHGFGAEHRASLVALQRAQRRARNIPDGYWIASADPTAAYRGITLTIDAGTFNWAVIATDGVTDILDHAGAYPWRSIARYDERNLAAMLHQIHTWEEDKDATGQRAPRAKIHDDKTIAVVTR